MSKSLQTQIREWLDPHCEWLEVRTSGRLPGAKKYLVGKKGMADIWGMTKKGKIFFIEVKRPKEPVREDQALFLDKMAGFGYLAMIARSLDEVKTRFRDMGYTKEI